MTDDVLDPGLVRDLRAYAEGGVRPVNPLAIAEAAVAAGSRGRVSRTMLILLAAVLALAAAVAVIGGGALRLAMVAPRPAPTVPGTTLVPVLVRSTGSGSKAEIVVAPPGGEERVLRQAGGSPSVYGLVSEDGWLALGASAGGTDAWVLGGLVDASRPTRTVRYAPVIGGAWSPTGGRFATTTPGAGEGFPITVTDAATGASRDLGRLDLPGGGPDIVWTRDGTGLLVRRPQGSPGGPYGIQPVDGGPVAEAIPSLTFGWGRRYVAEGGAVLVASDTDVSVDDPVRGTTHWFGGLGGHTLKDVGFTADGKALWLLLERLDGEAHVAVLARADAPDRLATVAEIPLGEGVAHLWFDRFAADDSIVAIGHWLGELGGTTTPGPLVLVSTADGTVTRHAGTLLGFVRAALLEGSQPPAPAVRPQAYAGLFEPVLPDVDGILGSLPSVAGLDDGRVLALAGDGLQIFDPAAGRLATAGRTVVGRTTGTVLLPLPDGTVLITGGDTAAFPDETGPAAVGSATAELFDPATGVSSPVGGVAAPWGFAAARLTDGSVLLSGGTVPVAAGVESPALAAASVFDPAVRRFTDVDGMAIPRTGHHIVPLLDGGALVVGGALDTTAERYDPETGTFTVTGAMSDPGVAAAVGLPDGRVLVIHGRCSELQRMDKAGDGDGRRPVPTEIFDPATGRFVEGADLPHCVSSATPLPTGEVLVEGFWGKGRNTPRSGNLAMPGTAWSGRFDPATGRVVETAAPDRWRATPVLLPDGSVLFVGGNPFSDSPPSWASRYR